MITNLPRGIRNNNPGNLRQTQTNWQGEIDPGTEKAFEVFATPVDGLRAMMVALLNYDRKHKLNTVRHILNKWAPPIENDTGAYARVVAKRLGVGEFDYINVFDPKTLMALAIAITLHENGKPLPGYPEHWYAPEVYEAAQLRAYRAFSGHRA